jgi:hypothetical protein
MSTSTSQITNLPGCLDKPNILFIQADQMASIVCLLSREWPGNRSKLGTSAKDGVVFVNCYCSSPFAALADRYSVVHGHAITKCGERDEITRYSDHDAYLKVWNERSFG